MAIKNIYNDIRYGFQKLANGDISLAYDENSINQSLTTLFLTKKGERFFNPDYGSTIYKYIYEPFDRITGNNLARIIYDDILFWESRRVDILKLNIDMDENTLTYNIKIVYRIKSTQDSGNFNLKIQKV